MNGSNSMTQRQASIIDKSFSKNGWIDFIFFSQTVATTAAADDVFDQHYLS